MKKSIKFLIVCLFMCSLAFCDSETIQAGIKYTEAQARVEAFKNIENKIDRSIFEDYLKDKNRKENLDFIKQKKTDIENKRLLCPFYLNETLLSYSITYYNNPQMNFYYNILGSLIKFEIVQKGSYPRKTLGYSRYGNLLSVCFEVDEDEQFVYDEKGKLIAHWYKNELVKTDKKFMNKFDIKRGTND